MLAVAGLAIPTLGQDPGADTGTATSGGEGGGGASEPGAGEAMEHDPNLEMILIEEDHSGNEPTTEPSDGAATQPASQPVVDEGMRPGDPPRTLANNRRRFRSGNTTPPVDPVRVTRPMSKDYGALLNRSVFLKGKQAVVEVSPSTAPTTLPVAEVISPQRNMVFNGVTETDESVALIEDATTHRVSKLRAGDTVAGGKIISIAFDSIEYQSGGKLMHIRIGQNLEGAASSPTTGPSVYIGEGSGTSAGGNSLLEQMRRRRQQELNR